MRRVRASDMKEIAQWYKDRDSNVPATMFPEFGYIVPGLVAGFLYKTDSDFVILDGFISNPYSDRGERDMALEALAGALLEDAEMLKAKSIVVFTKHPAIEDRAKRRGFMVKNSYMLLVREL